MYSICKFFVAMTVYVFHLCNHESSCYRKNTEILNKNGHVLNFKYDVMNLLNHDWVFVCHVIFSQFAPCVYI